MPLLRNCLLILPFLLAAIPTPTAAQDGAQTILDVWLGTSRAQPSKGIYHCTLNTKTGRLSTPELAAGISGPGFLAMHPKGGHLYAVGALNGQPCVAAYAIKKGAPGKSTLEFVNSVEIGDGGAVGRVAPHGKCDQHAGEVLHDQEQHGEERELGEQRPTLLEL